MKFIREYTDYLLDLDLSDLERSEIDNWLSKYKDSYQFSGDVQLDQSMDSIIHNLMNDLNIPADKKSAVQSYVSSNMEISDDESYPVLVMSPYAKYQYADFADGLSRYEIN